MQASLSSRCEGFDESSGDDWDGFPITPPRFRETPENFGGPEVDQDDDLEERFNIDEECVDVEFLMHTIRKNMHRSGGLPFQDQGEGEELEFKQGNLSENEQSEETSCSLSSAHVKDALDHVDVPVDFIVKGKCRYDGFPGVFVENIGRLAWPLLRPQIHDLCNHSDDLVISIERGQLNVDKNFAKLVFNSVDDIREQLGCPTGSVGHQLCGMIVASPDHGGSLVYKLGSSIISKRIEGRFGLLMVRLPTDGTTVNSPGFKLHHNKSSKGGDTLFDANDAEALSFCAISEDKLNAPGMLKGDNVFLIYNLVLDLSEAHNLLYKAALKWTHERLMFLQMRNDLLQGIDILHSDALCSAIDCDGGPLFDVYEGTVCELEVVGRNTKVMFKVQLGAAISIDPVDGLSECVSNVGVHRDQLIHGFRKRKSEMCESPGIVVKVLIFWPRAHRIDAIAEFDANLAHLLLWDQRKFHKNAGNETVQFLLEMHDTSYPVARLLQLTHAFSEERLFLRALGKLAAPESKIDMHEVAIVLKCLKSNKFRWENIGPVLLPLVLQLKFTKLEENRSRQELVLRLLMFPPLRKIVLSFRSCVTDPLNLMLQV
mmetsp:Transcript_3972/g.5785  ORF Transcript_3972/g.5785 Transcript_3972/m.5785 type:complete len:599 (+) Transcript_3972:626-2422(+)|eukprot:CAMPEP_0203748392 /NCGR_PEP_ID=MMETSP0098-20131031/3287_1 /ASSEMBLY_ACC=CAM_ASM_000208 /TAXON_ID=96639 /ORGANISM=" , Strain NY0313808BC1" /LENGTH=598 /DNA_ID=CAMNT_0050637119 /DNA_START=4794 /DNA_END=6590 /DNA_ORIENTATION=+